MDLVIVKSRVVRLESSGALRGGEHSLGMLRHESFVA